MLKKKLLKTITSYNDFPKRGINFKDILPIFEDPELFESLINQMASNPLWREIDSIVAIDARGFILGSCLALKLSKPLLTARKPGKLPGKIIKRKYNLEYGTNELEMHSDSILKYDSFGIVDDLLATGGTVKCVEEIIRSLNKEIKLLSVIVELKELKGRKRFSFETESQITF